MLLSRDAGRAAALAAELDGWNRERQTAETRVVEEAMRLFSERRRCADPGGLERELAQGGGGIAAGRWPGSSSPVILLAAGTDATGPRSLPGLELHGFLSA